MLEIYQMKSAADKTHVRKLFWEYLQWANTKNNEEYGINFDIEEIIERDMLEIDKFSPPHGRLLLSVYGDQAAGLACMRTIREGICEIKRMYVRPEFRGKGVGGALLDSLIGEAREMGYTRIRLDSSKFMTKAHLLYRSRGFEEISSYPESEIPEELHAYWIFMEKQL